MSGALTMIRMLWFGSGLLGLFILTRDPDKLVFDSSLRGSTLRTITLILTSVCAVGGPVTLLIALAVRPKQICPACHRAVPKGEVVCRRCGQGLPPPRNGQEAEAVPPAALGQKTPAVQAAIKKGIRFVNLPIPFIMMGIWLVGMVLGDIVFKNTLLLLLSFVMGFIAGWVWWSYALPRWRRWALQQPGILPDELQAAAEEAMLVWPIGHFFEKTEFKVKN